MTAPPAHTPLAAAALRLTLAARRWALPGPWMVSVAYAGFGLAWIYFSDRLLQALAPDVVTLSAVSQGKGFAFVLVTSALIYGLAARRRGAAVLPAGEASEATEVPGGGTLFWVLALLTAALVLAGVATVAQSASRVREQRIQQLHAAAETRATNVRDWMARRIDSTQLAARDGLLRDSLFRWQHHPDETVTTQLRQGLNLLQLGTAHADALLLDLRGALLLSPDGQPRDIPAPLAEAARQAAATGRLAHTDFYAADAADTADDGADRAIGPLRFDVVVPLTDAGGVPAALLALRTAPARVLLPQLLARAPGDEAAQALLLRPGPDGFTALAGTADGSPPVLTEVGVDSAAMPASLACGATLRGQVVAGLGAADTAGEPLAAVAVPVAGSAWLVAMQWPASVLHGNTWTDATALALANVLAVLLAGAVLYVAQQRREQRLARQAAAEQQDKLRAWKVAEAIANCSTDAIFAKDLDGRYLFVNREVCRILDRSAADIVGADASRLFPPEQVRQLLADDAVALQADTPLRTEARLDLPDGSRLYAGTKGRLVDDGGLTIGTFGVWTDVTQRRAEGDRLRQWATVFENMRDGIVITDAQGSIQAVNRAFTAITGYSPADAEGQGLGLLKSGQHSADFYRDMWQAIHAGGHWQGEIWNRRKNGEVYPEWLVISAVREGSGPVTHYVGVFTDISRLKHSEAQAEWLVHYDPLTQLPNRVLLQRQLEQTLSRTRRHGARTAVLVIDLDGFKTVNDSLGHPAGDELLVCIAARLKARLREEDVLGRLGGDEFLVILETGPDASDLAVLARDLLAAVAAPVPLACGRDAYITASIGISIHPDDGSASAVELLRDADAAMYRAKDLGRHRFCFYTCDMNAEAMAKLELEAALSRAIERHELVLHYQPKVEAGSNRVVGAEALLRWERAGFGLVPPGQFIPVAEHSSLILAIGAWVIDAACQQIRAWMDAGQPVVRVAVNVAARQFAAGDLDTVVARALERHRVPARCLEVELTEGMLMSNPQAGTAMLQRLRDLGVTLALDDFGTGYSSLAYLQQFPIDTLKIDQSFVRRIGQQPDGAVVVDAVIALAHRLRLSVVAEGVETAAQRDYLQQQGCDEMQGYHFGRPAPAAVLQGLLAEQASASVAA